jgi:hypothetical protein
MSIPPTQAPRFVVCVETGEYKIDLALHKIYEVLPDDSAERSGWIRVVDESGEDFLYPTGWFRAIEVSEGLAAELRQAS